MRAFSFFMAFLAMDAAVAQVAGGDVGEDANLQYRLPNSTIPIKYKIDLVVNESAQGFAPLVGKIYINIKVLRATNTIRIHAGENLSIQSISLYTGGGRPIPLEGAGFQFENITEILTIAVQSGRILQTGKFYDLEIAYLATLNEEETYGPYQGKYDEKGATKYYIGTHFEATYARRAFPCYDEPVYKARFEVSMNHHEKWTAIFNSKRLEQRHEQGNRVTDIFATTPPMATHLVAFVISEYTKTTSLEPIDGEYPNNVWSKKEAPKRSKFTANLAPKVLEKMEDFTTIPFRDLGFQKMDEAILVGFQFGGMENYGLVTLGDYYALPDEQASTQYNRSAAILVAHELTHQWFGDYVGLKWWSDLWLKEAFGTYFAYYILDKIMINSQIEYQFVPIEMQPAFITDAQNGSQPVSVPENTINSFADIVTRFDRISYNKAASINRMLRHILGNRKYHAGLQNYLKTFKFSTVTGEDLWRAVDAVIPETPYPVVKIMENWTLKSGYPVVNVVVNNSTITFMQERFLLENNTGDNTAWYVPISYTTACEEDFVNTKPKLWLTPQDRTKTVQLSIEPEWIIVNLQESGYYRVNYDLTTWSRIGRALCDNPSRIHVLNRAQIVDDAMNLAQNGNLPYKTAFDVIAYLDKEADYIPWLTTTNVFKVILQRTGSSILGSKIAEKLRSLMHNAYQGVQEYYVPRDDSLYYLRQELLWKWQCKLGNQNCIAKSEQMFRRMKRHNVSVPANLRSAVYCSAIRGSNNTEDWFYLWERYLSTDSQPEKTTIIDALGCTKNESLRRLYQKKIVEPPHEIPTRDLTTAIESIADGNPDGVNSILAYIKDSAQEGSSSFPYSDILSTIESYLSTDDQIQSLQDIIDQGDLLDTDVKDAIRQTIQTAISNRDWVREYSRQLEESFCA